MDSAPSAATQRPSHGQQEIRGSILNSSTASLEKTQLRSRFPNRELIVRAEGQSRFITLTPRMQMATLAVIALAACISIAALATLAYGQYQTRALQATLLARESLVAQEEQQVTAFHDEIEAATLQLDRRQKFLERMVEMLPEAEDDAALAAQTAEQVHEPKAALHRIGAALPEARGLAAIERRQLAMVDALTGFAEDRARRAEQTIRKLGLDPRSVVAATQGTVESGLGGPLEKISTEADGSLDPRFERLGHSLARMTALEEGLAGIPQVMPTFLGRMTSNFGFRRDPFTGEGAMHSGLDFGGRSGDSIRAAAAGEVSFVGTRSGYGNVVEITHGNGLLTRYAHMSSFKTRRGQTVEAGDVIGAMGSTGRSTGPHLHFEVRMGGHAINPRPFLEAAPDILASIR